MKAYEITAGKGIDTLRQIERPNPVPGPGQVLVRLRAASLNYRDFMVARGAYRSSPSMPIIPLGDGAGDVVAIGAGVTRFRPGDRVMTTYFPNWTAGPATPHKIEATYGTDSDGVLTELMAAPEGGLVSFPSNYSYEEAATLTCVATTAWNALFEAGRLQSGDSVLLQGTGGLSISALQLAKAAGLRVIMTSSSDAKLERARALGADATINYVATPDWQDEVLRLTESRGVDLVLDVGGEGTIPRSIASARVGGLVAVIGGLTGFGDTPINMFSMVGGLKRLEGVMVGSTEMLEKALRVYATGLRPIVDRVFDFAQAREAYRYMESGKHFGKVVISID